MKKAIILSSGGIDSTTAMAIANQMGFSLYSLSFDYGQRHIFELECSKRVALYFRVKRHIVIKIDLRSTGGSALTSLIDVPKHRIQQGIPITYVPARNTIFLSFALAWAEVLEAWDIFIGVNIMDFSGYPDCTQAFITAFEEMANIGTKVAKEGKGKFKIHTPLIKMRKSEIIKKGLKLDVDYSITHSCYDPDEKGLACGACDSCLIRRKGFEELGVKDPTKYKEINR